MPFITTDDGVKLAYEETGSGTPVVFVHEFAGDMTSWEPQLRTFGMRYRAIAYNARGYPPSDVPPTPASYSQDRARLDILAVLDGLLGGIYEPDDGHVDPTLATNAMAQVAMRNGGAVRRYNPVHGIRPP